MRFEISMEVALQKAWYDFSLSMLSPDFLINLLFISETIASGHCSEIIATNATKRRRVSWPADYCLECYVNSATHHKS